MHGDTSLGMVFTDVTAWESVIRGLCEEKSSLLLMKHGIVIKGCCRIGENWARWEEGEDLLFFGFLSRFAFLLAFVDTEFFKEDVAPVVACFIVVSAYTIQQKSERRSVIGSENNYSDD